MNSPALGRADLAAVDAVLAEDDALRPSRYPGDERTGSRCTPSTCRQTESTPDWSPSGAQAALAAWTRTRRHRGRSPRRPAWTSTRCPDVWSGVRSKLETEPIEDLRVDLEDGFGDRGDEEEDAARSSARARPWSTRSAKGQCPPYVGVRFKSLEEATRRRGIRSLDLILGARARRRRAAGRAGSSRCPRSPRRPRSTAMVELCGRLERAYGLPERRARLRDPGGDIAGDPGRRRRGRRRARWSTPRTTAAPGCTSAPTTTPRHWGSPAASSRWTILPPTTPSRSCSWRRPAPASGSATARPTSSRSATARSVWSAWAAARPARTPLVGARLLPGLGSASGSAADPVPRDLHVLPARLRLGSGPARRVPRRRRRRRARRAGDRAGDGRRSWCAECTAVRCRPTRSRADRRVPGDRRQAGRPTGGLTTRGDVARTLLN